MRRHLILASLLVVPLIWQAQPATASAVAIDIDIDNSAKYQKIDGFGVSTAFRRNELIKALPEDKQREILDLWFSREKGAGLSLLRLGIGARPAGVPYDQMVSIQPEDPGGPAAPPKYVWDGDDNSQVWMAKAARRYGVERFFADAWSAPGYMKDNGDARNGGTLLPEWQQAYANYLVQYAKFYKQEGIKITDLGFTNEPDWTAPYESMRFTPEQAAQFVKVLGPAATAAHVSLVCCDSFGWDQAKAYTEAIEADPEARRWVKVHTGHSYASPPTSPLPTGRNTWMSEWGPSGNTWDENWDDGSGQDGMTIAQAVHDALTLGNASAYIYWLGVSSGATRAFISVDTTNNTYRVSKRLWAMAAYSRFIRPGAVRIGASASDPALEVSAFRNADGSRVIEILNTGTGPVTWDTIKGHGRARAYVTDENNAVVPIALRGKSVTIAPRALTTIVLG